MKKICFLLFIATALSGNFPVQAYTTCKGGTLINSGKYCRSAGTMNWYSAVNWCKGNGGELVKIATLEKNGYSDLSYDWIADKYLIAYNKATRFPALTTKHSAVCE